MRDKPLNSRDVFITLYTLHQLIQAQSFSSSNDFQKLVEVIQNLIPCDLLSIFQFDYQSRRLKLVYLNGKPVSLLDRVIFQLGKGAAQWVVNNHKTLLVADTTKKLDTVPTRKFVKSFLGVPIIMNGYLIGALMLGSFTPQHFRKADKWVLEIIGTLIGAYLLQQQWVREGIRAVINL